MFSFVVLEDGCFPRRGILERGQDEEGICTPIGQVSCRREQSYEIFSQLRLSS